jgi:hypothetical protein
MPPATALALAGPLYEPRFRVLISITFFGRLSRFLVVAGAATIFCRLCGFESVTHLVKTLFLERTGCSLGRGRAGVEKAPRDRDDRGVRRLRSLEIIDQ